MYMNEREQRDMCGIYSLIRVARNQRSSDKIGKLILNSGTDMTTFQEHRLQRSGVSEGITPAIIDTLYTQRSLQLDQYSEASSFYISIHIRGPRIPSCHLPQDRNEQPLLDQLLKPNRQEVNHQLYRRKRSNRQRRLLGPQK